MAVAGQGSGIKVEKDTILADINKRILDAFDLFDCDGTKTVDVRYESQGMQETWQYRDIELLNRFTRIFCPKCINFFFGASVSKRVWYGIHVYCSLHDKSVNPST